MILSIIIFIILLFLFIGSYNGLVKARNKVKTAFATIDVQLKKRHDLIPNLVAAVKAIMKHEKELLENITAMRSQAMQPNLSENDRIEAETQLSQMLGQLNVNMENYPQIKSDRNVLQFQASLNECEEQISASRRVFNSSVNRYNDKVETFPSNMIAGMFNFKTARLFEIAETERQAPAVESLFNS